MKKKRVSAVTGSILGFLAFLTILPAALLFIGSFTGDGELGEMLRPVLQEGQEGFVQWRLVPLYPTLKQYVELLVDSPSFFTMFWNSVKLTGAIIIGQLLVGVPAAWGFSQYRFWGKRVLFLMYVALMMMPFQVLMLSDYLLLDYLNLLDTHLGLILPAVFSTFPVFIMYRFFTGIPKALIEAARLDGAGHLQIFFKIALPLGSPGVLSAVVLGFLEYWNFIEQPMAFLKTKSLWPFSLFLPQIGFDNAGLAFAASVVVMIPALFVFAAGQNYLEQGIVSMGIKE